MFEFLHRFRGSVAPSPVTHRTQHINLETPDVRLQQALRSLSTPRPGTDFDRKVLDKIAVSPTRHWRLSPALLPRLAALSLLLVALVPTSRAVLRTEAQSQWNYLFGNRFFFSPGSPDSRVLAPSKKWVAGLPPLTGYHLSSVEPRIVRVGGSWGGDIGRIEAESTIAAFRSLRNSQKDNPTFLAARLRHALGNGIDLHTSAARRRLRYNGRQVDHAAYWRSYRPLQADLEADAVRGSQLEPENAFFPLFRAAVSFSRNRDAEAIAVLKTLPGKSQWEDYGADEITARYRYEKTRGGMSVLTLRQILALETFSGDALEAFALRAIAYAADREKEGHLREGAAIRVSVLDLGAKLMTRGHTIAEGDAGGILSIAQRMVGGDEPILDRDVGAVNRATSGAFVDVPQFVRLQARRKWETGRPDRLIAFLRAHGEPGRADWAENVLNSNRQREKVLSVYWDKSHTSTTPEILLRAGWISLAPLALGALIALTAGGMLTGLYRLGCLKRREEFPAWIIVGGITGCSASLLGTVLGGLFRLDVSLMPWPAFAVLVLGVGYLCLRRPRLVLQSALVATAAGWLTQVLILKTVPLIRWGLYLWTDMPEALGHSFPRLAPIPFNAWATVPITVALMVTAYSLIRSRRQGLTWQGACQRVSRRTIRTAAVFTVAFCILVSATAWSEKVMEQELLANRWDVARQITQATGRTYLAPLPFAPALHP